MAEQLRNEFQQSLAPMQQVGSMVNDVRNLLGQQVQQQAQQRGETTFSQIVQQHPIFQDADLGEDAVRELSIRFQNEGRSRPLPELVTEVASKYQQKSANILQRQLTAAQTPPAPGLGAAVPPSGGTGPMLQPTEPKNLKDASEQLRRTPLRPMAGQA